MTSHVVFLGFVVSSKGVESDTKKVKAILEWPKPANLLEARSFHGLTTFYKRFIQHFSTIMAPITDCLKRGQFSGIGATNKAFKEVKKLMTEALVLRLLDFSHD